MGRIGLVAPLVSRVNLVAISACKHDVPLAKVLASVLDCSAFILAKSKGGARAL